MQFLVKSISLWQQKTKNFEVDKIQISRDLDLPLKTQHQELKVWCLANNLREKQKNSVCLNFSIVVITQMNLK